MSCCPSAPEALQAAGAEGVGDVRDTQMQRGENVDCYMGRATNPTGKHDDATGNVDGKIENTTVPIKAGNSVDVAFRLQAGSTRAPTSWELKHDGSVVGGTLTTGVSWNSSTGRLNGVFGAADGGKTFKITVTANDGTGEIDSKSYAFAPTKPGSDTIQFIHPLPGATVTSRFNPQRVHPVTGQIKPHGGADFALPNRATSDVLCAADGEVIFTGFEAGGAGNYVKVKHLNGSGAHLCTTVYMHLAKIYVAEGQRLPAGQSVGKEGNTGIGTGAHLHFECRLPNGTKVDPVPYIRGSVQVAQATNPDNTAVAGSVQAQDTGGTLSKENVDARQSSCETFGPSYPSNDPPAPAAPAPSGVDPFELAWHLTMQTECIGWVNTPPTDPATLAGLIETKQQRRNCGYVDDPDSPDGVAKFGIAQKFNVNVNVKTMDYSTARNIGYSNYWQKSSASIAASKPRTAIAVFNLGYLLGNGGINQVLSGISGFNTMGDVAGVGAVCDGARAALLRIVQANPARSRYKDGWLSRVERVRSYCLGVSI